MVNTSSDFIRCRSIWFWIMVNLISKFREFERSPLDGVLHRDYDVSENVG